MGRPKTIECCGNLAKTVLGVLDEAGSTRPMLVCGHSFMANPAYAKLLATPGIEVTPFHDYEPNPRYESVVKGLELFCEHGCDMVVSVGGGSAMDVAKAIKAYWGMEPGVPFVEQQIVANDIPQLAVPTTSGTGSEATHFAVIYYEGRKVSVSHESLLPDYAVLDGELLSTLPTYQRVAPMMDALCHAVESFWSVRSSVESRACSERAIGEWMASRQRFLGNDLVGDQGMLRAADDAGKAINLTTTTAAHAMSYKLTSLYGIAHGHAAAIMLPALWEHMLAHLDQACDERGPAYVREGFDRLARLLGCANPESAITAWRRLCTGLGLEAPRLGSEAELDELVGAVNPQRLSNNPVALAPEDLRAIYLQALRAA